MEIKGDLLPNLLRHRDLSPKYTDSIVVSSFVGIEGDENLSVEGDLEWGVTGGRGCGVLAQWHEWGEFGDKSN